MATSKYYKFRIFVAIYDEWTYIRGWNISNFMPSADRRKRARNSLATIDNDCGTIRYHLFNAIVSYIALLRNAVDQSAVAVVRCLQIGCFCDFDVFCLGLT